MAVRLRHLLIIVATLSAIIGGGLWFAARPSLASHSPPIRTVGGEIQVAKIGHSVMSLASNRFTCASCARRVIPAIKALRGVRGITFSPFVGISRDGAARNGLMGTLVVSFNPSLLQPGIIAAAAQRALQADPYNRGTVRLVYH